MVSGEEVELDHVANGCFNLVRVEDQIAKGTHNDLMRFDWARGRSSIRTDVRGYGHI